MILWQPEHSAAFEGKGILAEGQLRDRAIRL